MEMHITVVVVLLPFPPYLILRFVSCLTEGLLKTFLPTSKLIGLSIRKEICSLAPVTVP